MKKRFDFNKPVDFTGWRWWNHLIYLALVIPAVLAITWTAKTGVNWFFGLFGL